MTKPWTLDESKFLSEEEVAAFRRTLEEAAIVAQVKKHIAPVRDWAIFDLALSTGLRVSEISGLRIGDLFLGKGQSSLVVRRGKGGRSRSVRLPEALKRHFKAFIAWKQARGEPTGADDFLFSSKRCVRMTVRALQHRFKYWAWRAGLSPHHFIHHLRHTYATFLLKASGYNLRLVQKQLGHSSVAITQVYADVSCPRRPRRPLTSCTRVWSRDRGKTLWTASGFAVPCAGKWPIPASMPGRHKPAGPE